MLGLLVVVCAVVLIRPTEGGDEVAATVGPIVSYASWGAFLILVPMAYFVRNQIYKRHWQSDAVAPQGYFLGNVIFLGLIDLPAVLSVMALFLGASLWPDLLPWVLVVLVVVLNWPGGQAMQPVEPRLGVAER